MAGLSNFLAISGLLIVLAVASSWLRTVSDGSNEVNEWLKENHLGHLRSLFKRRGMNTKFRYFIDNFIQAAPKLKLTHKNFILEAGVDMG